MSDQVPQEVKAALEPYKKKEGRYSATGLNVTQNFDPCFVETYKVDDDYRVLHIARASRFISLTQDSLAGVENSVIAVADQDLLVYGDRVRVVGPINLPGRNVTIFCHELDFAADKQLRNPGITVSGKDRENDNVAINTVSALAGEAGTEYAPAGKVGKEGQEGPSGHAGRPAGKVSIFCEWLRRTAPIELSADGGRGGDGARGQGGGAGGAGKDDLTRDTTSANGGPGGNGGNGGDGGAGGNGGTIRVFSRKMEDSPHRLTISVSAGSGGNGGDAGVGGNGGKGGQPSGGAPIRPKPDNPMFGKQYDLTADGADGGGPGGTGNVGFEGGVGMPGTIILHCPQEIVRHPWSPRLPYTPSLRLIRKLGTVGERGKTPTTPAQPGAGGDPAPICKYTPQVGALGVPIPQVDNTLLGNKGCSTTAGKKVKPRIVPVIVAPERRMLLAIRGTRGDPSSDVRYLTEQEKPMGVGNLSIPEWEEWQNAFPADVSNRIHWRRQHIEILRNCWHAPDIGEIAKQADLEQLQMLYDFARNRFLLAPTGTAMDVPDLKGELEWLVDITAAKLGITTGGPLPLDRGPFFNLWQAASATYGNLVRGKNLVGKDSSYVVLGDLKEYSGKLTEMLNNLKEVEDAYQQSLSYRKLASQWATDWNVVTSTAELTAKYLRERKDGVKKALGPALEAIKEKETARDALLKTLIKECEGFQEDIQTQFKIRPEDIFGALSQLSFTNREFHSHSMPPEGDRPAIPGRLLLGGGFATGAMILSQVGELAVKAIENAVTDTGEPVNKKYIIRRVQKLGAEVKTLGGLRQARSGLLSLAPGEEERLLTTREQLNSICENFYQQFERARDISKTLDEYIEAVQERSEKVDDWNGLLIDYANGNAELEIVSAQKAEADQVRSNDPGLMAIARYSTALNRHALEKCLDTLYYAGRVYTLYTLEDYDIFAEVAGAIDPDTGVVNSATLKSVLNDFIHKILTISIATKTDCSPFPSAGKEDSGIEFRMTKQTHPRVFARLNQGLTATFSMEAPDAGSALPDPNASPPADPFEPPPPRNIFALKADVRLTHILPSLFVEHGNPLSKKCSSYTIQLKHSGNEAFYAEDGKKIDFNHKPVEKMFSYSDNDDTDADAKARVGALSLQHSRLIGPFCTTWEMSIPSSGIVYKEDVSREDVKLESIRIDFRGEYRGFTMDAVKAAETTRKQKAKKNRAEVEPIEVTAATFDEIVLKSKRPVIVALPSWDNYSKTLQALVEETMLSYLGRVRLAKFHVYEPPIPKGYEGPSAPAVLVLFKDGKPVGNPLPAAVSVEVLRAFLNEQVGTPAPMGDAAGAGRN